MTSEIAILNKGAVALAADSAVTVDAATGPKIYNSVNKLFALSKYRPVGVMVYGNAEFMGAPWELIIKTYRERLNTRTFASVKQYADHFLNFLQEAHELFPNEARRAFLTALMRGGFAEINQEIMRRIGSSVNTQGSVSEKEIAQIADVVTGEVERSLDAMDNLQGMPVTSARAAATAHRAIIEEVQKAVFEQLPMTRKSRDRLRNIATLLLYKSVPMDGFSGLVIAGYGEDDVFPSLVAYELFGLTDEFIRFGITHDFEITSKQTTAAIVPFAQGEMVYTFMEGIAPSYREALTEELLKTIGERFVDLLMARLPGADLKKALEARDVLLQEGAQVLGEIWRGFEDSMYQGFAVPIVQVVGVLPKDELAQMAEALVSLTSFKRRVSWDAETVGGPIDVAVISKGDGLVWIKRKHYFQRELNPAFFANYFRKVGGDIDGNGA